MNAYLAFIVIENCNRAVYLKSAVSYLHPFQCQKCSQLFYKFPSLHETVEHRTSPCRLAQPPTMWLLANTYSSDVRHSCMCKAHSMHISWGDLKD